MVGVDSYMICGAETDSESTRLRNIQQASDSFTIKHLEAIGIGQGWRCLEIGAGGGSIAGWLGDRVGASMCARPDGSGRKTEQSSLDDIGAVTDAAGGMESVGNSARTFSHRHCLQHFRFQFGRGEFVSG
jgi:hypothetical protein